MFLLDSPNLIIVAIGTLIMALTSSIAGTFVYLRQQSLMGDVLSHAVFPGVCISFLISGEKDNLTLLIGATVSAILAIALIQFLSNQAKVKQDAALAYVLSTFFAIGIMILAYMQNQGISGQSGIGTFLFGSAASILLEDFWIFSPAFFLVFLFLLLFYKELKLTSFDRTFALTSGIPIKILDFIISTMALLAIITGIQAMGVVLMAALIIIPPTIGRIWSSSLLKMLLVSGFSAAGGSLLGTFWSSQIPGSPTGPWIVIFLGVLAVFSFILSPSRGLIAKQIKSIRHDLKIHSEHLVKLIYKSESGYSSKNLKDRLSLGLLSKKKQIKKRNGDWELTPLGTEEGKRLIRLHRLWEVYLTKKMGIAPDHVHEDADSVEHIISGDVEELLLETLDRPGKDPHNQEIPYSDES
jgi:manganese/zinc/iron transport system permease protein